MKALDSVKRTIARGIVSLDANSPVLFMAGGLGLIAAGVFTACKATLKAKEIMDEYNAAKADIDKAIEEHPDEYTQEDVDKDVVTVGIQTGWKLIKTFALPAALLGGAVYCIIKGHLIQGKRLAGMASALASANALLAEYRTANKEIVGEEAEENLFKKANAALRSPDGTKLVIPKGREIVHVEYVYPESNEDVTSFLLRVIQAEKMCRARLAQKGFITLNEIRNELDERAAYDDEGLVLGVRINKATEPTSVLTFGINGLQYNNEQWRDFESEFYNDRRISLRIPLQPLYGNGTFRPSIA